MKIGWWIEEKLKGQQIIIESIFGVSGIQQEVKCNLFELRLFLFFKFCYCSNREIDVSSLCAKPSRCDQRYHLTSAIVRLFISQFQLCPSLGNSVAFFHSVYPGTRALAFPRITLGHLNISLFSPDKMSISWANTVRFLIEHV